MSTQLEEARKGVREVYPEAWLFPEGSGFIVTHVVFQGKLLGQGSNQLAAWQDAFNNVVKDSIRVNETTWENKEPEPTRKEKILSLLCTAIIGSCTCMRKTPEVKYHSPDCRYRVLSEAEQLILGMENDI